MRWPGTILVVGLSLHHYHGLSQPNILVVLADDVGINDVSWNNPRGLTPHLGKLAQDGIILDNAYSLPVCTPSRSALLTGVYPFKLGLQRGFGKHTPEGIPLNTTLLPQYMKDLGYQTHGLGKWHLGFCSQSYTPLKRGFDTYHGLFVGDDEEDIKKPRDSIKNKRKKRFSNRKKNSRKKVPNKKKLKKKFKKKHKNKTGKQDLSRNLSGLSPKLDSQSYSRRAIEIIKSSNQTKPFFMYLALFTKSYPREVRKIRGKKVENHRVKLLQEMDSSMGDILNALKESGQYENTVIFFISDNGGRDLSNLAENENPNYPLRGSKGTVYEGGTKVPGFLHSPLIGNPGSRFAGLFHLVDLVPTLLHLASPAGLSTSTNGLDGLDQWNALVGREPSPRKIMIYNIDDNFVPAVLNGPQVQPKFQIALREDHFKLIWGQPKMLHRSYRDAKKMTGGLARSQQILELYNLNKDPEERNNVAKMRYDIVLRLKNIALNYYRSMIPPRFMGLQTTNQVLDESSDYGGVSGWCRAVVLTTCGPVTPDQDSSSSSSSRWTGSSQRSMMELFYGTIPGVLDPRVICVSQLE